MRVCIYGAASDEIKDEYKKAAWELGFYLGQAGIGVVFGGGATGLMGAAAKGMKSSGDSCELIGVAPRFFDEPGVLYEQCSEMIWTETMRERKQKMEELADAFIVLPGGIGTFEEFFEVLTLKQLERHNKPIILYNVNGYYDRIRELLHFIVEEQFLKKEKLNCCCFADTLDEINYFLIKS